MVARQAAWKGVANNKLRRSLAYNGSSKCADAQIGNSAPGYKASDRKSAPRWRAPEKFSDVAETGETVKFGSQTFKVAGYRVRKQEDAPRGA